MHQDLGYLTLTVLRQTVPKDYAIEVCNLFAQLGSRGTSILFRCVTSSL